MSMLLIINNKPYNNFITGEVEVRLDVLCNTMSFSLSRSDNSPLPFKLGDKVEIEINGKLIFTGHLELLTVAYSGSEHLIEIAGRDLPSDLLDSNVDELDDIEEGASLKAIIENVIKNIGSSLKIDEQFSTENFNPVNDISAPNSGDNAFQFVEKHARQRQVLLSSNGKGEVVIARGESGDSVFVFQNVIEKGSEQNNILSGNVSYDNTGRYNFYKLTGQGNPSALPDDGSVDLAPIVKRGGGVFDNTINKGRQLVLSSESSYSDDDNFNRALWEANIRQARGRLYTIIVLGYSQDDIVFLINKRATINDEFAGIKGKMLINSIKFSFSSTEGERTQLSFVEPNAYTLTLEEPIGEEF